MNLRDEAMLMLEKRGAVLQSARAVSRVLHEGDIRGAVIGGVAVVLHGHVRTTVDVDVFIDQPLDDAKAALERAGIGFDPAKRQFDSGGVPVHLVTPDVAGIRPEEFVEIEGIQTVRLGDLISMKLHSGTRHVTRAQDIADVIGLIRARKLTSAFASQVAPPLRKEFRRLVKAVQAEPA